MINFRITKFLNSSEYSIKLDEFYPVGDFEVFTKAFAVYLGEAFGMWYQGFAEGIGHMNYQGYKLGLYWTDFPDYFAFDCRDEAMALELKGKLIEFFNTEQGRVFLRDKSAST